MTRGLPKGGATHAELHPNAIASLTDLTEIYLAQQHVSRAVALF